MTGQNIMHQYVEFSPQEIDGILLKLDLGNNVDPALCAALIRWLRSRGRLS